MEIDDYFDNEMDNDFEKRYFVFKDDLPVRYLKEDERFVVLPAIPKGSGEPGVDFLPYRRSDLGFTNWVEIFSVHKYVGRTGHILSPRSLDPGAFDPLLVLYENIRKDPEFFEVLGFTDETMKATIPDAYKVRVLDRPTKLAAFNGIVVDPRNPNWTEGPAEILVVNASAIFGVGYRPLNKVLGDTKVRSVSSKSITPWGFAPNYLDSIPRRDRKNITGSYPEDEKLFDYPDFTNPDDALVLTYSKEPSPLNPKQGWWLVSPDDPENPQRVQVGDEALQTRVRLPEAFMDIPEPDYIDKMIEWLAPIEGMPDAMVRCLGHHIPGLKNLLEDKGFGVRSSSAARRPATSSRRPASTRSASREEEDDIPMSHDTDKDEGATRVSPTMARRPRTPVTEDTEEERPARTRAARVPVTEDEDGSEEAPAPARTRRRTPVVDEAEGEDSEPAPRARRRAPVSEEEEPEAAPPSREAKDDVISPDKLREMISRGRGK